MKKINFLFVLTMCSIIGINSIAEAITPKERSNSFNNFYNEYMKIQEDMAEKFKMKGTKKEFYLKTIKDKSRREAFVMETKACVNSPVYNTELEIREYCFMPWLKKQLEKDKALYKRVLPFY